MKDYSRVYMTVDLDAIRANMVNFRKNIRPDAMLCGVIKTDGYGLGAVPIARKIRDLVWGFAVATIDEALNLRKCGIDQPILVLGYVPESRFEEMIREEVRFAAFQEELLKPLSEAADRVQKKALLHIKIDTGMGRIGLPPEKAADFAEKIAQTQGLFAEGLFSHLACADQVDKSGADIQRKRFEYAMKEIENRGIPIPIRHLGNSAASMELTDYPGEMFRVGIALYGYYPSDEMNRSFALYPAMELKSRIVYKKTVPVGTPIGYGASFCTERETVVATVPIGYGDGYPRSLSNKGCMLVCGKRAPIIGRVCMDQVMLDITDIPKAETGDTVIVIGKDGEEEISLDEAAELSGRFNYEFLCDLGKRIPRVYFSEGKEIGSKDYFEDSQN